MTDKKKTRARNLSKKTGMTHQAAVNQLNASEKLRDLVVLEGNPDEPNEPWDPFPGSPTIKLPNSIITEVMDRYMDTPGGIDRVRESLVSTLKRNGSISFTPETSAHVIRLLEALTPKNPELERLQEAKLCTLVWRPEPGDLEFTIGGSFGVENLVLARRLAEVIRATTNSPSVFHGASIEFLDGEGQTWGVGTSLDCASLFRNIEGTLLYQLVESARKGFDPRISMTPAEFRTRLESLAEIRLNFYYFGPSATLQARFTAGKGHLSIKVDCSNVSNAAKNAT